MLHIAATAVLTYAMHSAVICVLAFIMVRVARLDAASRCVVWRAALFLPLVTATFAVSIAAKESGGVTQISVIEPMRSVMPSQFRRRNVEMIVTAIKGRPETRTTEVDDPLSQASSLGIVLLAVSMCSVGLVTHLRRTSRIRTMLRARTPARRVDPVVARRSIAMTESELIEIPIALRGREICIPGRTFQTIGDAERTSVLLHEIAHIERNDPLWMDASRAVCSMTWWQPLTRIVCERLELDTEAAADERAVALGAPPHALVAGLAYFAG
ncbi:MAG: M56 family metallopeptidase, partial [Gemmatimonadales bacterium]